MRKIFSRPVVYQGLMLLFFVLVVFLVYSNSIEGPFIFDDIGDIKENSYIRLTELTFENLKEVIFNSPASARPLPNISFALNYYFDRYDVTGYHIVNIIIHIITGILLFFFIKTTLEISSGINRKMDTGNQKLQISNLKLETPNPKSLNPYPLTLNPQVIAFSATLLWLVHPLCTQSVTYMVQRMTSMAAMFYVLSFLFYVKGRLSEKGNIRWLFFFGSILSGICALGSKQIAATLPFFILLYEWYFFQDLSTDWIKKRFFIILGVVILIVIIAFIYMGMNPVDRILSGYTNRDFTLSQRVLTEFRVVILYMSLLIFPHPSRLTLDYDFPISHSLINPVTTLFSLSFIILLIVLAIYLARRHRLISFCILWFLGNLVIESSVIGLELVYEHRTYLPSMFVSLLFVILLFRYIPLGLGSLRVPIKSGRGNLTRLLRFARNDDKDGLQRKPYAGYRWINLAFLLIVVSLFSFWTYERNSVWSDELAFLRDCVAKSPSKARPHNNLGFVLFIKGEVDEAIEQFSEALRIKPDFMDAKINIGYAMANQGNFKEAISYYSQVLKINPRAFQAHNNMGLALEYQGKIREAIFHYQEALKIKPDYTETLNNLGNAFACQGNMDEAIKHFKDALKTDPDNVAVHNNMGTTLYKMGRIGEAIKHYRSALKIDRNSDIVKNNLRCALSLREDQNKEIDKLEKELKLHPEDHLLHFSFGNLYQKRGEPDKAIGSYEKALSIDSSFIPALQGLALVYSAEGDYGKSLSCLHRILELRPDSPEVYYNIACMYARRNEVEESISWLKRAIEKGFDDWELISTDNDLEGIRGSSFYGELIKD